MITAISLPAKPIIALPKANGRMPSDQFLQGGHQHTVIFRHLGIPEHRWWNLDQLTGLTDTQFLLHKQFYCFPFVVRPPYFFSRTFFTASISRVTLATIRFRRLFSSSSSFIRFTSLASIPPYFAFQL